MRELPRETVRKGGTSDAASVDMTVYGRRNGSKISIWRSGGLCWTRIQDFSDGLRREIPGNQPALFYAASCMSIRRTLQTAANSSDRSTDLLG